MPIFPELRPYLDAVWDEADPGTFVITRYREKNSNLRTQLQRIIERAGLKPWPKLFHNLRATRETELAQEFPLHVVCAWIGNSATIAAKHYLQVTDEHFAAAQGKAAKKTTQHTSAHAGSGSHSPRTAKEKTPELPGRAAEGDLVLTCSDPRVVRFSNSVARERISEVLNGSRFEKFRVRYGVG